MEKLGVIMNENGDLINLDAMSVEELEKLLEEGEREEERLTKEIDELLTGKTMKEE